MSAKDISIWIAIVTAVGTCFARFSALEERQQHQLEALTDVRGYLTAAEQRISVLERDREMLERVHAIELRLGAIEEQMKERRR